ncbi:MAG: hypothetical protein ABIO94_10040 [Opitutaceae bacterium]
MKTRHLIVFSILAGSGAPASFAQALTPPLTEPAKPAPAPATPVARKAPEEPKADRTLSSGVSAAISAGMPKYNPPPKAPEPKPEEDLPDLRDTDKPKNQIIRLPEVLVREPRNPVFRERDVNTKEGLAAVAERRYISDADRALNRWNIFGTRSTSSPNSTTGRSLAMYAEEERLKNMADLNDAAGLVSASDKAAGAYIKREAQNTYMRTSDFGWKGASGREDRGMNDAATAPR